jgi:hypothetical protein
MEEDRHVNLLPAKAEEELHAWLKAASEDKAATSFTVLILLLSGWQCGEYVHVTLYDGPKNDNSGK